MVTEIPRLPLPHLRELRVELDTCLSLLHDNSRREGGDKHDASATEPSPIRPVCTQGPAVPITASERTKLLPLVSALLSETLSCRRSDGGRR